MIKNNKYGLRYLNTNIKKIILYKQNYKLMKMLFIKIYELLRKGYDLIYRDEYIV